MKKAGGIIAIIAGIFAVVAAIVTLFIGGVGAALNADGGNTVIGLGWGGVLFSFLVIVFGAIAIGAKGRWPGVLLIVLSIGGAILGGTLVAIFMALALIGGILAMLGAKPQAEPISMNTDSKKSPIKTILAIAGVVLVLAMTVSAIMREQDKQPEVSVVASLDEAAADTLQPQDLAAIYAIGGDSTDLQRDNKTAEIKGKVINWVLEVYEVSRKGEGYRIQTSTSHNAIGTFINLTVRDEQERAHIEGLKTGDIIQIKGMIADVTMRNIEIDPAVLFKEPTKTVEPEHQVTPESETVEQAQTASAEPEPAIEDAAWTPPPEEVPTAATGPSFDCTKVGHPVEKMICGDHELSRLDRREETEYKERLATWGNTDLAKTQQREWISKRNACQTPVCVRDLYVTRSEEYAASLVSD